VAFGYVEAVIVFAFVGGMTALIWYELRTLRTRRLKVAEKGNLPERSFNALTTTRAIREALRNGGVESADADIALMRAEGAHDRGAYMEVIELTTQAREVLTRERAQRRVQDDLARLERLKGDEEETTKEKVAREMPPNFVQAKFTLNLARDAIDASRGRGYEVAAAEAHFGRAQSAFDGGDHTLALSTALQAKRAAEEALPPGVRVVVETAKPGYVAQSAAPSLVTISAPACANCGATLAADDEFCRKCGTAARRKGVCPDCGAAVKPDDAFCRKCGAKV